MIGSKIVIEIAALSWVGVYFLSRVEGGGFHVEGEVIQCRGSRVPFLIKKEKLNRIIKND